MSDDAAGLVNLLNFSSTIMEEYQGQLSEHIFSRDLVSVKFQILSATTTVFTFCVQPHRR